MTVSCIEMLMVEKDSHSPDLQPIYYASFVPSLLSQDHTFVKYYIFVNGMYLFLVLFCVQGGLYSSSHLFVSFLT